MPPGTAGLREVSRTESDHSRHASRANQTGIRIKNLRGKRCCWRIGPRCLEVEEVLVPPQTAAVTDEFTVSSDYAVERDEDGDTVVAVGSRDGPHGVRSTERSEASASARRRSGGRRFRS